VLFNDFSKSVQDQGYRDDDAYQCIDALPTEKIHNHPPINISKQPSLTTWFFASAFIELRWNDNPGSEKLQLGAWHGPDTTLA